MSRRAVSAGRTAGDRAAAVLPLDAAPRPSSAYTAPRTELERLITGLLGEMLGIEKRVHDYSQPVPEGEQLTDPGLTPATPASSSS